MESIIKAPLSINNPVVQFECFVHFLLVLPQHFQCNFIFPYIKYQHLVTLMHSISMRSNIHAHYEKFDYLNPREKRPKYFYFQLSHSRTVYRITVSRSLVHSSGSSRALSGAAGTGCFPIKASAVILGFYAYTLALSSLGLICTDHIFVLICTDFLLWQFQENCLSPDLLVCIQFFLCCMPTPGHQVILQSCCPRHSILSQRME